MSDGVHSTFTEKGGLLEKKMSAQNHISISYLCLVNAGLSLGLKKMQSFLGNVPFQELVSSIKASTKTFGTPEKEPTN